MTVYNEEYIEEKDEEMEKEMLMRQAKLLYSDVDEWVLELAIKSHLNMEKLGEDYNPTAEEGDKIKATYFAGNEYKTVF